MPITQVHTYENGLTIGFDSDVNDWVRVDRQALEGSTLGNIGRAAQRSGNEISLGIRELLGGDDARTQAEIQQLRQEQEAAAAGAPIASAVGGAVPDIAAGGALALGTGGMGLVPLAAAEAGLGALLGGIRPGSVEDRATNAALYSVLSVAGLGLGAAAVKGIGAAVKIFGTTEARTLGRISDTVDAAGTRLRAMDDAAAAEAAPAATTRPGQSTVGAAATPEGELDLATQMENRLLREGEEAGADLMDDARMQQMADRAGELDMPVPIGFGSRRGSPARMAHAVSEMSPFGDVMSKRIMNQQQARMSQLLGEALGVPNASKKSILLTDDLADAEAAIGAKFDRVQASLPNIDGEAVARALETVGGGKAGVFGPFKGQTLVGKAIENARARGALDGEEFMNTRATVNAEMADAFARGDIATGDMLMKAVNKLDDLAKKELKRHGKEKVGELWETARTQWRVYSMTKAPGAVNVGTGEVNPLSLFNRMKKDPARGGWGRARPPIGTPARRLFDALEIGVASANQVPMTGARALTRDLMQSTIGKTAVGTAAGAATGASIWDALR